VTTLPVDNLTLAVFRSAEFGFLGFVMPTFRQTPLRFGAWTALSAGEMVLRARCGTRQPWGEGLVEILKALRRLGMGRGAEAA
jgi:hypothetical protein